MVKMSDNGLMTFAKELTKIALENNLIPKEINNEIATTSEEMAMCVSNYYKTLLATLNPEE